ncbi:MAG: UDP-3-O-(3-hydroxymyristoyl)glucosamine N-acyltransferase [Candidatus Brocadiia bacterium]
MPELSAAQIARMTGGRLVGPQDVTVSDIRSAGGAGPGDVAFVRDAEAAAACRAGVLIAPETVSDRDGATVVCDDPEAAVAVVLQAFAEDRARTPEDVSPDALVDDSASLGQNVAVGAGAYVGPDATLADGVVVYPLAYVGPGCRVSSGTVLFPHACLHAGVTVGADCIIHYGAVIGGEGFGFIQREGRHVKLPQVGTVRIGDRVEIGALTAIDRGMLEATVIEDGTKVDNLCQIAHNCQIGTDCVIAGCASLAGSVRLGKEVVLAGGVDVADHVTVGDGAVLAAGSAAAQDVEPGAVLLGRPARPIGEERRIIVLLSRLPEMSKRLRELEKRLDELAEKAAQEEA